MTESGVSLWCLRGLAFYEVQKSDGLGDEAVAKLRMCYSRCCSTFLPAGRPAGRIVPGVGVCGVLDDVVRTCQAAFATDILGGGKDKFQ